ncbi:MAG: glucose-6-phosphate dehydrogenase [Nitrosopumilus sp.]
MNRESQDSSAIVIFGGSGDLTKRKLIPALHSLKCEGVLSQKVQVIGIARTKISTKDYGKRLYEGVVDYSRLHPDHCGVWSNFEANLTYLDGKYDDPATYRRLLNTLENIIPEFSTNGNCLFYLATPPTLYPIIVEQLGQAGLSKAEEGWRRIIIEKPFGRDLESARQLNDQVHTYFDESQVYRIDHYLGKETVQNILTFRFANGIFEPIWNRNYIDHIQITVAEDVGIGSRAGYYEEAGVVRDMLQNHLLQLVTLTAMEPPHAFNEKVLRDEKAKVLKAIRPISPSDCVWGQYRGYREEEGTKDNSKTPTYVALRLFVDNWRWNGVPFYLRSAKSLGQKVTEIGIQFKDVPQHLFPENTNSSPNRISICIQPDEGFHLQFETKVPGAGMKTTPRDMEFHYSKFGDVDKLLPDAYERLLLDAVHGDPSLFARSDEIEQAWTVVAPLLNTADADLAFYDKGSWGPIEAAEFIGRDGRSWKLGCDKPGKQTE